MPGNLLTSGFPLPVPEMPKVADPDPHVFGPPGSGSIGQEVRIRILPFPHKGFERTKNIIMLENKM